MSSIGDDWPDADRRDYALTRILWRIDHQPDQPDRPLSPRELRCLEGMSHGLERAGTAELLGIDEETVKNHLRAARRLLRAKNTTHAVAIALRDGLLT